MITFSLRSHQRLSAAAISLGIFLPVFFQIKGGIFRDPLTILNSGGVLSTLPIPLSVAVCFLGIPMIGGYRNARVSLAFVITSFGLMLLSSVIMASAEWGERQSKLIILLQFVIPMFAMVLGQLYEKLDDKTRGLAKVFLGVLWAIVPFQLFCSWFQTYPQLSPYLYVISIYQHLQYVPVVFTAAFVIVLFSLGHDKKFRNWILLLLPVMGLYVVAATSIVAMSLFCLATVWYSLFYWALDKKTIAKLTLAVMMVILLVFGYLYHYRDTSTIWLKFQVYQGEGVKSINIPGLQGRLSYWGFYGAASTKDVGSFLVGNARVPDRKKYPSAHNYFLDFLYYFGFFALVPLLILIGGTVYRIYRERKKLRFLPNVLGITVALLFLVFVENMLKVGLRQPYPGIFTFFLWGILISKLSDLSCKRISSGNESNCVDSSAR